MHENELKDIHIRLTNILNNNRFRSRINTANNNWLEIPIKDVIDNDMWSFDFSNVPMLLGLRGGSAYMTRVIDGVPENVHHSSGVTGLCDGLLWGGYPMCFILVAIYVFMCFYGDNNRKMLARPPFRLILFFFFYSLVFARAFSFFIDSLFMSSIVSIIIKIMIAKYYYKKLV